jgi:hypothetical protein
LLRNRCGHIAPNDRRNVGYALTLVAKPCLYFLFLIGQHRVGNLLYFEYFFINYCNDLLLLRILQYYNNFRIHKRLNDLFTLLFVHYRSHCLTQ